MDCIEKEDNQTLLFGVKKRGVGGLDKVGGMPNVYNKRVGFKRKKKRRKETGCKKRLVNACA